MKLIFKHLSKFIMKLITFLLAILLFCNLYLITLENFIGIKNPTIFGYSFAVIVSGSMEPALSVNDLIFNHKQNSYTVGDIITFRNGNNLTTHRIIKIAHEGYITQGDANNTHDLDIVSSSAIVGKVVGKIPYIGWGLAFFKSPLGLMMLVIIGLLIIDLPYRIRKLV